MADSPKLHAIDPRFATLCAITRAQHFAWREAVRDAVPDVDPCEVVMRMWEVTGHQTAAHYRKRIDPERPLAPQVAASIVWSSDSMGETARVELPGAEDGDPADAAFVRHLACPWLDWHRRLGLLAEDRPGCDVWFRTLVEDLGKAFGKRLRVETLETLPEGAPSCLRRLWVE